MGLRRQERMLDFNTTDGHSRTVYRYSSEVWNINQPFEGLPDLRDPLTLAAIEVQLRERWFAKFKNPLAVEFRISYFHEDHASITVEVGSHNVTYEYEQSSDLHRIDALLAAWEATL